MSIRATGLKPKLMGSNSAFCHRAVCIRSSRSTSSLLFRTKGAEKIKDTSENRCLPTEFPLSRIGLGLEERLQAKAINSFACVGV